ncbi:hypothetical protein FKM82_006270, partial [Ascaphus truei]
RHQGLGVCAKGCRVGVLVQEKLEWGRDQGGRRKEDYLRVTAIGMCNPRNYSDTPPTSKSTVEELHEPIPSLFRALTEGDTQLNWNIVSFPVVEELSHHENLVSFLETVNQPQHQNVSHPQTGVHVSHSSEKEHMCTVVYFDDCMSIHQCKVSCESMGASKYRWFHNACCECIGPECIDYGSKTVKCMNCMF